jgi:hypothetical protein
VTINAVAVTMQLSGGQLTPIFINEVLVAGAGSYLYTEQGTATTEPNLIPDQFIFIDKSNVPLGQFIQSDPITVTGLTTGFSTLASISGDATSEYRINGGSWITATASVNNGNTIEVRHQSSGLNSFDTNTTLALGPLGQITDTFTSTTQAAGGELATTSPQISVTATARAGTIPIEWTFDQPYEVGQYITGDYFVVDPGGGVTVRSVSPAPTGSGSTFKNGSVVNSSSYLHGFDGRGGAGATFSAAVSATFPLVLNAGDSLGSSRGVDAPYTDLIGYTAGNSGVVAVGGLAVLTCVSTVPFADQFRPPYVGTNKPVYRESQLQTQLLPSITLAAGKPSLASLAVTADYFARPWWSLIDWWQQRPVQPADNMGTYGREIDGSIDNGAALLCLDYTLAEKRDLLIGMVQQGIELYHTTQLGASWAADCGHNNGRLFPIIFAGLMLGNTTMRDFRTTNPSTRFGELELTRYSTAAASSNPGQSFVAYWGVEASVIGFGDASYYLRGCTPPAVGRCTVPDNEPADGCPDYHTDPGCCTSMAWTGKCIASRLMNMQTYWQHDAFFDYVDRYQGYGNDPAVTGADPGDTFSTAIQDLWDQERPNT